MADTKEVVFAERSLPSAEGAGEELIVAKGVLEAEVVFKIAVLEGRMKEEVELTTAVAFVVMLVLTTGSKQPLYILSHIEIRVSSPLLRQASSATAHLFLQVARAAWQTLSASPEAPQAAYFEAQS